MNKVGWLIVMFFSCGVCVGQNLVPNGDFEQYSGCPTAPQQIDSLLFWFNPSISPSGTPDYFNQCSNPSIVGVPDNAYGFQQGHSGSGYCGIGLFPTNGPFANWREYIEVPLLSPLTSSQCYHFEMFVSLANSCTVTTDDIGVYFSNTAISGVNNSLPLPYTPQIINSTGFFTDTLNWTLVSGNYTAIGGENFLLIGNFKNDFNTDTLHLNINNGPWIFVYIDDVSLTLCTGIEEQNAHSETKIYPNPFTDKLNITLKRNELVEVNLYDVTSRKIFNQSFTIPIAIGTTTINTEQLAKGIYIYEVRNKNGVIKKGKVVKE